MKEFDRDPDEISRNPSTEPSISDICEKRVSRRTVLRGAGGAAVGAATFGQAGVLGFAGSAKAAQSPSSLAFEELTRGAKDQYGIGVAAGYRAEVLVSWGDPVLEGGAPFDPENVTAERQERQFGYNNDFVGFLPIDGPGSGTSDHGLLCVTHEYTDRKLMVDKKLSAEKLARLEMAAHGHCVLEIKKVDGKWDYVRDSKYNRRISALSTDIGFSGPAAGHDRLKTSADPTGMKVRGTVNNCSGGKTPWGTVLIAEENFNYYFGESKTDGVEARSHARYGIGHKTRYPSWAETDKRFDPSKEPNEPNRFGWMVEVNPYRPGDTPVKRTALGRFKHESASIVVNHDGRVVVYSGDDQYFEYIYRFVSAGKYNPKNGVANGDLLDDGVLSVARFDTDGTVRWLPLVYGKGELSGRFGFHSQADVLIDARLSADRVGATPMDRPEEVAVNPATGDIFAIMTKNKYRTAHNLNAANPREKNKWGHILRIVPAKTAGGKPDHAADVFTWEMFIAAGDPDKDRAVYHPRTSKNGWFACPDNMAFDPKGRIWIATDGLPGCEGCPDGVYAADTEGPGKALTKHFFDTPAGAELCGPEFTPDGKTFFVAVQHPGEESDYANPSTRWPADKDSNLPPRPSVVVITKEDGGVIGG